MSRNPCTIRRAIPWAGTGILALFLAAGLADGPRARAAAPQPTDSIDPAIVAQVTQALDQLDSDEFAQREQAAAQLDALLENERLGPYLAAEFGRRLLAADTSFEVRARLERYLKELPPAAPTHEPVPSADEIVPLLDRFNSNFSAERDTAQRRLVAMLAHTELIGPVLQQVKGRLAQPGLNRQTRRALESVLDAARKVWVHAEPSAVTLPPVSEEAMHRWLDDLTADPSNAADRSRRDTAHRELVDLLVRDDTRDAVVALLKKRHAGLDGGQSRYQELIDFAKPAMAAEVWGHQRRERGVDQDDDWDHRQHITVQHLLVGVPQMAEGAQRPTHFDAINDKTAHCVSGNSLTPGDYPVRVAIPHPNPAVEVMFYLVNLPTPRHRLRYAYHLRRDEADRLMEISQHTLDYFLAQRKQLDETHVLLLLHLDPRAVSRFAGAYFQAVPDKPITPTGGELGGRFTLHSAVCAVLARVGTNAAIPAIEKLARSDQMDEPNHENPFHIAWIAALSIAKRDPWPEVDSWLAGLIDEREPMIINTDPVPDLGATAAGLLLARHGVSPYTFDLEPAGNNAFDRSRFAGFHFTSDAGREAVRRWWSEQQSADDKKATP